MKAINIIDWWCLKKNERHFTIRLAWTVPRDTIEPSVGFGRSVVSANDITYFFCPFPTGTDTAYPCSINTHGNYCRTYLARPVCSSAWRPPAPRCWPAHGRRTGFQNSTRTIRRGWTPERDTCGRSGYLKWKEVVETEGFVCSSETTHGGRRSASQSEK